MAYSTHVCRETEAAPDGRLPFLLSRRGRHVHFEGLLQDFFQVRSAPRAAPMLIPPQARALAQEDRDECLAYSDILRADIRPTWVQAIWSDETLFTNVLQPLYLARTQSWPVRTFLVGRHRRRILGAHQPSEGYRDGLEALARRLGDAKFFGGDQPSALDACLGADLLLIPFLLPASHRLHREFTEQHALHDYSLQLLEFLRE